MSKKKIKQNILKDETSTEKMFTIYVLKLHNNKFYVGKTYNLDNRLLFHKNVGTSYTRKFKFKKIVETIDTNIKYMEHITFYRYVEKYGIDNVRGDIFSREILPPNEIYMINKVIRNENGMCFSCGDDHFINRCDKKLYKKLYNIDDTLNELQKIFHDCNIPYENDDKLLKENLSLRLKLEEMEDKTLWNVIKNISFKFYEKIAKFTFF